MGLEIERKFLVDKAKWEALQQKPKGESYQQAYLVTDPEKTIRVRLTDANAYLTIKGITSGLSRPEFEYEIPQDDARQLIKEFAVTGINKIRYKITFADKTWEVDEFLGDNEGLILAEVELEDENETVEIPEWVGKEVTDDKRYYNLYLSEHPFKQWGK